MNIYVLFIKIWYSYVCNMLYMYKEIHALFHIRFMYRGTHLYIYAIYTCKLMVAFMHVCMCFLHVCVCIFVCVGAGVGVGVRVFVFMYVCVYVHARARARACVCMCVCMCTRVRFKFGYSYIKLKCVTQWCRPSNIVILQHSLSLSNKCQNKHMEYKNVCWEQQAIDNYLSIYLAVSQSVCRSVCLCFNLSPWWLICLSNFLSVYLSVSLTAFVCV